MTFLGRQKAFPLEKKGLKQGKKSTVQKGVVPDKPFVSHPYLCRLEPPLKCSYKKASTAYWWFGDGMTNIFIIL